MRARKGKKRVSVETASGDTQVAASADMSDNGALVIAGIGASAGGIQALTQFFRALPSDSGVGFVVIQHLAPERESILAQILARDTSMPVIEVKDAPRVEPNHVYVIPPNRGMTIAAGQLRLLPRSQSRLAHRPIDSFFRSLATERHDHAIAVILSGTGSDGTLGLQEVKAEGGVTFAQDITAEHDGMPKSAIATGSVDFILPPEGMATEIARIASQHGLLSASDAGLKNSDAEQPSHEAILQLLRDGTGIDFTNYRTGTLRRRIARRMLLEKADLRRYVELLSTSPREVEALRDDVLINVTRFFRDPAMFASLREKVLPGLVEGRSSHDPLRVWVLGCSTGEEAYSLAIALTEFAEESRSAVPIQIFATDLSGTAIEKARAGVYPKGIEQDVSQERLRRFFNDVDGHYRISKAIRDVTVFARHNVIADPPFSKIDVISCRNLLIYMEPVLQQTVVPVLFYGLKPGGTLVLGSSETVTAFGDLFEPIDAKQKIFRRKPGHARLVGHGRKKTSHAAREPDNPAAFGAVAAERMAESEADRILLANYAPPSVLIDAAMNIVQVRGDTGSFLTPPAGKATLNLLKMARGSLTTAIRSAVAKAKTSATTSRHTGTMTTSKGEPRAVEVEVVPIRAKGVESFLVLFHEFGPARTASVRMDLQSVQTGVDGASAAAEAEILRLMEELTSTHASLQAVIEEQEAVNEEAQAAIEEAQAANEELQSVNEELETSKEEIQSSSEELETVNVELQNRNAELQLLNTDLANLISSVPSPIVMLGRDLRIRRFNASAEKVLHLIPSDIGRPIVDIRFRLSTSSLDALLTEVIELGASNETDVQDPNGRWHSLRLSPYRTLDDRIDGVLLVLIDIDPLKRALGYAESIVQTVREPLVVLTSDLHVRSANRSYYKTFEMTEKETVGRPLFDLADGRWDTPAVRQLLEASLVSTDTLEDVEVEQDVHHIGRKNLVLNARRFQQGEGDAPLILLAIEDVTERRQLQRLNEATLSGGPITALLEEIAERLCEGLAFDVCTVLLLEDGGTTLRARASSGLIDVVKPHVAIPIGQGIAGTVAAMRAPLVVDDAGATGGGFTEKVRSVVVVPILSGDDLRGVLQAGSKTRRHFTEAEVELTQFAADRIAQALDREARDNERTAREAVEATARAKDDFFASLSHELRTPLTSILGWTQLVRQAEHPDEVVSTALENIERGAQAQKRLIDDMLEISRLVHGDVFVLTDRTDIAELVRESIASAEPVAALKGVVFDTRFEPALISGDQARLRQAFGNLLSNATKFSPEGGHVQVSVDRLQDKVSISVTDHGKGIAAEFLPRVFDRFAQQEKGELGGLGLGLAIARHIVERHGGTIQAESDGVGKGASLRVILPLDPTS